MKWMRERDLLIAQTMAFVQSVTGKKPEADQTVAMSVDFLSVRTSETIVTSAPMPDVEALLSETVAIEPSREARTEALRPVQTIARADLRSGFQSEISEIKARVANFRAHQERFNREREDYCSATMAKVHAALRDRTGSPRLEK
ncbi:MAG: hypothetical protein ABI561_16540 [Bradyrhizobium sp.]